jgi:hypothetical protein
MGLLPSLKTHRRIADRLRQKSCLRGVVQHKIIAESASDDDAADVASAFPFVGSSCGVEVKEPRYRRNEDELRLARRGSRRSGRGSSIGRRGSRNERLLLQMERETSEAGRAGSLPFGCRLPKD